MKERVREIQAGVQLEESEEGIRVFWKLDDESPVRVFISKDPSKLTPGELYRFIRNKHEFETVDFKDPEQHKSERIKLLLEELKLKDLYQELDPIYPESEST